MLSLKRLLAHSLMRVFCFLPLQNKMVFSSFDGKNYSDSPKAIYEELKKEYPNFTYIWLLEDLSIKVDGSTIVKPSSIMAIYHLATSKVWVDNVRKRGWMVKRKKQFYIQTWHGGLGIKKIEKDCAEFLPTSYIQDAKKDSSMTDLCLSNSKHLTRILENSFWYSGRVLQKGMPKNDELININTEQILEIKKSLHLEGKKICLYAPTFRKSGNYSCYNIDYRKLKEVLEQKFSGEWIIIIKLHPSLIGTVKLSDLPNDVLDYTAFTNTTELLKISDCMISDYSSIIFDFILMNRPAFIYAADYQLYCETERDVYFKLNELPFSIAENNQQLEENIINFDHEKYQSNINCFEELTGLTETGQASKYAADEIAAFLKKYE